MAKDCRAGWGRPLGGRGALATTCKAAETVVVGAGSCGAVAAELAWAAEDEAVAVTVGVVRGVLVAALAVGGKVTL